MHRMRDIFLPQRPAARFGPSSGRLLAARLRLTTGTWRHLRGRACALWPAHLGGRLAQLGDDRSKLVVRYVTAFFKGLRGIGGPIRPPSVCLPSRIAAATRVSFQLPRSDSASGVMLAATAVNTPCPASASQPPASCPVTIHWALMVYGVRKSPQTAMDSTRLDLGPRAHRSMPT
jgi:hypothetical protein